MATPGEILKAHREEREAKDEDVRAAIRDQLLNEGPGERPDVESLVFAYGPYEDALYRTEFLRRRLDVVGQLAKLETARPGELIAVMSKLGFLAIGFARQNPVHPTSISQFDLELSLAFGGGAALFGGEVKVIPPLFYYPVCSISRSATYSSVHLRTGHSDIAREPSGIAVGVDEVHQHSMDTANQQNPDWVFDKFFKGLVEGTITPPPREETASS